MPKAGIIYNDEKPTAERTAQNLEQAKGVSQRQFELVFEGAKRKDSQPDQRKACYRIARPRQQQTDSP